MENKLIPIEGALQARSFKMPSLEAASAQESPLPLFWLKCESEDSDLSASVFVVSSTLETEGKNCAGTPRRMFCVRCDRQVTTEVKFEAAQTGWWSKVCFSICVEKGRPAQSISHRCRYCLATLTRGN